MKNKDEIAREIMKRVVSYEKKRLRLWYEIVSFVLLAVLFSEVLVLLDLVFDIGERDVINFWWVLGEDFETIKILSGSILKILWEELPWIKVSVLLLVSTLLGVSLGYVLGRRDSKKMKAGQIRKYEKTNS